MNGAYRKWVCRGIHLLISFLLDSFVIHVGLDARGTQHLEALKYIASCKHAKARAVHPFNIQKIAVLNGHSQMTIGPPLFSALVTGTLTRTHCRPSQKNFFKGSGSSSACRSVRTT